MVLDLRLRPSGVFWTHRMTYFFPLRTSVTLPKLRLRALRAII